MNEIVENEKEDWSEMRKAYDRRGSSHIEWSVHVANRAGKLSDGKEKLTAIAVEFGESPDDIGKDAIIGRNLDKFLQANSLLLENLPSGRKALWLLVCENLEGKSLSKTEIKLLCKNGTPTQDLIKARKRELGLLPPKPSKQLSTTSNADLSKLVNLIPKADLHGMSQFAVDKLEKQEPVLTELMSELAPALRKTTMKLYIKIMKRQEVLNASEINRQVKAQMKQRVDELDLREKRLLEREERIAHGMKPKDKKLIQSVLHPDKAPPGQKERYGKAFDAFRKVA